MDSGHRLIFRKLFIALLPESFAHRNSPCTDSKLRGCAAQQQKKKENTQALATFAGLFISHDRYCNWAVGQQGINSQSLLRLLSMGYSLTGVFHSFFLSIACQEVLDVNRVSKRALLFSMVLTFNWVSSSIYLFLPPGLSGSSGTSSVSGAGKQSLDLYLLDTEDRIYDLLSCATAPVVTI